MHITDEICVNMFLCDFLRLHNLLHSFLVHSEERKRAMHLGKTTYTSEQR